MPFFTSFQLRPLLQVEQVEQEGQGQQGAERAQEAAAQVQAGDEGRAQGDQAGHGVRGATQGQGGKALFPLGSFSYLISDYTQYGLLIGTQ